MPLADGASADLRRHPIADKHEDFATLVDKPGDTLGWTAALRTEAGDLTLSLENPVDLPITCLWYSTGGRYYSPRNSRHVGVLGIEEGRSYLNAGHKASIASNPHATRGIPTALDFSPTGSVSVRHVLGGLQANGRRSVRHVLVQGDSLCLRQNGGASVSAPLDGSFLK